MDVTLIFLRRICVSQLYILTIVDIDMVVTRSCRRCKPDSLVGRISNTHSSLRQRILCFELVAKANSNWRVVFHYSAFTYAYVDIALLQGSQIRERCYWRDRRSRRAAGIHQPKAAVAKWLLLRCHLCDCACRPNYAVWP